ncbi:MAG: aldo/keto reductase [Fimbriimonadales bacterium]
MEYVALGRTGVQVSKLCLGCMNFGWGTEEKESIQIIHHAIEQGVNFVDTANVYGKGASETIVGKALAGGLRERIVLATKVHARMSDEPNDFGNSRRHIIQSCEASLQRLQTDWIDLYQIHRPQPSIPIDETLRALDDLIHAGKVRYVGTTTFAAWQITEAIWVAKELGLNRFVTEQPPYNLLDRRIERELVPCCITYGIGLLPWSPLAGGLLTGKYLGGSKPEGARYSQTQPIRHIGPGAEAVIEGFNKYARERGVAPSQLALAWCAAQPGITSPIIGPRTMEQLEDNLSSLSIEITDEDRKAIDAIAPPGTHTAEYYVAEFGPSSHRLV